MPPLDEAEAPCSPRDLRDLPWKEVAPRLAVELRRLREEERLARKVHAVPEDVGGDAHVGGAGEEPVDLLAPRGERHRAVEDRHASGVEPVHLAREREHGLAAEGDDDRPVRSDRSVRSPTHSRGSLRSKTFSSASGNARSTRGSASSAPSRRICAVLAREQEARPGGPALGVVGPLHLVEDEQLARMRRHLDRQQMIGAARSPAPRP